MKDSLGDRMKSYYEDKTRIYLPRRTYTIIRLDGRSFSKFTKRFKKPFDRDFVDMSIEILKTGIVNIHRPDREFLLSVRNGNVEYNEIISMVEEKIENLDKAKEKSTLPETINVKLINQLIEKIRKI